MARFELALFVATAGFECLEEPLDYPSMAVDIDYASNIVCRVDLLSRYEDPFNRLLTVGWIYFVDANDIDSKLAWEWIREVMWPAKKQFCCSETQTSESIFTSRISFSLGRRPFLSTRRQWDLSLEEIISLTNQRS